MIQFRHTKLAGELHWWVDRVAIEVSSLRYLGEAYMKLEKFEEAVESLSKAVKKELDDELTHIHLATCYSRLGDGGRSLWHSKKAQQLGRG